MVEDVKSLSVMFAALKSINMLNAVYGVRFAEILADNGPEMASPRTSMRHPMERMLREPAPLLTIIHTASNVLSDPGRFKVLSARLASKIMGRGGHYVFGSFASLS